LLVRPLITTMHRRTTRIDESRPQTLIDNDAVFLCYHPQLKIVHHEFRRFVYGDQLRDILEKGLEALREHGARKWLSDDRRNGALKPADAAWSLKDWAPRARASGWKYWAVVLPAKILGQMNMNRWIAGESAEHGMTAQAFTDPGDARIWIERQ
jgi:hypothetical protein